MASNVKQKIETGFVWTSAERVITQFLQFVLTILIARQVGPDDYGVLGIVLVFINVSQVVVDCGLGSALVYKNKDDATSLNTTFVFNLAVCAVLFGALFVSAPFIESYYGIHRLADYLRVSSVALITNSLIVVPTAIMKIRLDFRSLAISNMVSSLCSGVVGVVMAYAGYGVWALVGQLVAKSLLQIATQFFFCRWMPHWQFDVPVFRELYRYGINIFGANCVTRILDEGINLVVGKVHNEKSLGLYTRSNQFASLPYMLITSIVGTALFPSLSATNRDKQLFDNIYRKNIEITAALCIPLFLIFAAAARPFIHLLLTDLWIAAVPILQILCVGRILAATANVSEQAMNAVGRTDLFFRQQAAKMVLKVVLVAVSLPFGIVALAAADAVSTLGAFFITNHYGRRCLSFGSLSQLRMVAPFLAAALPGAGACLGVAWLTGNSYVQLIGGVAVGVAVYMAVVSALHKMDVYKSVVMAVVSRVKSK